MKIRTISIAVMTAAVVVLGLQTVRAIDSGMKEEEKTAGAKHAAMATPVYVCPDCHVTALQAGKCPKCGKDMKAMHLLRVKDGEASLCSCGADCKCNAASVKDGKCGCGKDVVKVSVKGMCACPTCSTVLSDKEGKCPGCGAEMKKVE